jgi:hypothetical protein
MGNIANRIKQEDLLLPCMPDKDSLQVNFSPAPSQSTSFDVDDSHHIQFTPALSAGTKVHLSFKCPST